jgi:hypothetical protein
MSQNDCKDSASRSPILRMVRFASERDTVGRLLAEARCQVLPAVPGSANATFMWWLFNSAGWQVPRFPSTDVLITTLYVFGATIQPPHEVPVAGNLFVSLEETPPRVGLVAKVPLNWDRDRWFMALDETVEDHRRPYRRAACTVAYFIKLRDK